MKLWLTEKQTENLGMSCRIRETLFVGQSDYQKVVVADSYEFGRMLVLDDVFQTSLFDEFIYHEMIAHVPLFTHPAPKKVLVIGGGDGGTVREVVRHQAVESVEMVEIDGMVVEASKEYLANKYNVLKPEDITRTINWIAPLLDIIKQNPQKSIVVVVGSAHFPGKNGLIQLMSNQGYTFTKF